MTPREYKLQASFRNFAKMNLHCMMSQCRKQIEYGIEHKSLTKDEVEKLQDLIIDLRAILKSWKKSLKED